VAGADRRQPGLRAPVRAEFAPATSTTQPAAPSGGGPSPPAPAAPQPSPPAAPTVSLPKGGSAIRGIGEKFTANPDNLHDGLLAGEGLELDLRRMQKTYRDCNRREYELTKHISLQRDFPLTFLNLKLTCECDLRIPELLFDLDYFGHYMRRIKKVTLMLPRCPATTPVSTAGSPCSPRPPEPGRGCTGLSRAAATIIRDRRIVRSSSCMEAIASSTGINDSGMFEVNFHDERYLPFEFAGAVSDWRIELQRENNQFDVEALTDVILTVNMTAREGGEPLRKAASAAACCRLPGDSLRLFEVARAFPDAWPALRQRENEHQHPHDNGRQSARYMRLEFEPAMFPFVPGRRVRFIDDTWIVFAAPDADPGRHHIISFRPPHADRDDVEEVICVAPPAGPRCVFGVVDLDRPLGPLADRPTGCSSEFPDGLGEIWSVYLIARYKAECWPRCGRPRRGGCDEIERERSSDDR
jgi:hypothetical protein